jgi:hypothetical protein
MQPGWQAKMSAAKTATRGSSTPRARDLMIPNPKLRLMDQVREVLRVKHYAIRTEQAHCDWIKRYGRNDGSTTHSIGTGHLRGTY